MLSSESVHPWKEVAHLRPPSPVLALLASGDSVWAAGMGAVARFDGVAWKPCSPQMPLLAVTCLAAAGDWLFAGGAGIVRSADGGDRWQSVHLDVDGAAVTCLAPSPGFAEDGVILAGALGHGVLRSHDGGATWTTVTFGLETFEITALLWQDERTVLAATANGLYRSPNGGLAWRRCPGTEGGPMAALAQAPDGLLLAAVEIGGLLWSRDGERWQRYGDLPPDVRIASILPAGHRLFLGTLNKGLLVSGDGGANWEAVHPAAVLALAAAGETFYAGTTGGLLCGPDPWQELPPPPVHDLRRLVAVQGELLALGVQTPPHAIAGDGSVRTLDAVPLPVTGVDVTANGRLLVAGAGKLHFSDDRGQTWRQAQTPGEVALAYIAVGETGLGFAASGDGRHLWRTHNHGADWQALAAPFGVLTLAGLFSFEEPLGASGMVAAATYDSRRRVVQIWHSEDEGEQWKRGAALQIDWPRVSGLSEPRLLTLGGYAFVQQPLGNWLQHRVGDGSGVLRLVGNWDHLYALTVGGLYRSLDGGVCWTEESAGLPVAQVLDLVLQGETLSALLSDGRIWQRTIAAT